MMKIVLTTSLPTVDRPNADRWNAARLCQKLGNGQNLYPILYFVCSFRDRLHYHNPFFPAELHFNHSLKRFISGHVIIAIIDNFMIFGKIIEKVDKGRGQKQY